MCSFCNPNARHFSRMKQRSMFPTFQIEKDDVLATSNGLEDNRKSYHIVGNQYIWSAANTYIVRRERILYFEEKTRIIFYINIFGDMIIDVNKLNLH